MSEKKSFEYDLALSFAGEDRQIVDELASMLTLLGVRVFYDDYEKAELWGKDLYQHLQTVYRDCAEYCVVFVSEAYGKKLWTRHELKQAQARAFKESHEYILPVRLDDTEIPGLNATIGYIDLRQHSLSQLSEVIIEKLFGPGVEDSDLGELTWRGDLVDFRGQKAASFWPEKLKQSQSITHYVARIPRIRYGDEDEGGSYAAEPCNDCFAVKGEFHVPSCDVERCPACGDQAISCGCIEGEAQDEEEDD
jgi:hypothetical protein